MVFLISMLLGIILPFATVLANGEKIEIVENGNYFTENQASNLLVDKDGNDLQSIQQGKGLYSLDQVGITRYRQKVRIEYYTGDYINSNFIGADEGYGDYCDSVSDYMLKVPAINEKFWVTIPTNYKLAPYSTTDRSVYQDIPAYTGTDEIVTIKVLIAEVKKYSVSAVKYQNRQDLAEQPNPIGKGKTTIEALGEYWKIDGLSTNFSAIVGQAIDFKDVGQFMDSYAAGSRVGSLKYYGMYDASGNFVVASKFVVTAGLTGTVNLAGFYAVDDLGTPTIKPSYSSSMTSGASVGFYGEELTWESEKATELLFVTNSENYQKLSAYPFQLAGDPYSIAQSTNQPTGHLKISLWVIN